MSGVGLLCAHVQQPPAAATARCAGRQRAPPCPTRSRQRTHHQPPPPPLATHTQTHRHSNPSFCSIFPRGCQAGTHFYSGQQFTGLSRGEGGARARACGRGVSVPITGRSPRPLPPPERAPPPPPPLWDPHLRNTRPLLCRRQSCLCTAPGLRRLPPPPPPRAQPTAPRRARPAVSSPPKTSGLGMPCCARPS